MTGEEIYESAGGNESDDLLAGNSPMRQRSSLLRFETNYSTGRSISALSQRKLYYPLHNCRGSVSVLTAIYSPTEPRQSWRGFASELADTSHYIQLFER
jgi:hypothetical protein